MSDWLALATELRAATTRDEVREPIQQLALLAATSSADDRDEPLAALLEAIDRHKLGRPAIRRQLYDRHDQEEVEQDLLIEVAKSVSGFRAEAHFLTWLHTVATNCALGFVRRRRGATVELAQVEASMGQRFTSIATENMAVRQAIAALPPKYRDAVTLRDLDQLTYAQVAEQLNLNLNTARAHIARGRSLVASQLQLEIT